MISIILPIYNVEAYLPQSVESVLNQTYKDLQIILVDDGSNDGSSSLCEEYAKKDTRIKVIHKSNGGLSDARNVGTEAATGEWIFYLDADDWMELSTLEMLYDFAVRNNCDVVQGGLYYAYPDHMLKREEKEPVVLDRNAAMRELIVNDRVKNFAWGKLYKASLVKDLKFPKGKFYEDSYWQHLVMDRVTRYGIIDTPLIYYRQRIDSISGALSDRYDDLIEGYAVRLQFIQEKYPQFTSLMKERCEAIKDLKYPKKGLVASLKRFIQRVKDRFFPSVKYISIPLNSHE